MNKGNSKSKLPTKTYYRLKPQAQLQLVNIRNQSVNHDLSILRAIKDDNTALVLPNKDSVKDNYFFNRVEAACIRKLLGNSQATPWFLPWGDREGDQHFDGEDIMNIMHGRDFKNKRFSSFKRVNISQAGVDGKSSMLVLKFNGHDGKKLQPFELSLTPNSLHANFYLIDFYGNKKT